MPRSTDKPAMRPAPLALFLIFTRIGLTSFGGGLSGWLFREFVRDRRWIQEDEFLNGLALAQAMPGVNVTNMAIWIGYRLAGFRGAAASFFGIILLPAFAIVAIGAAFAWLSRFPTTHLALVGAAAASIGLSFTMAFATARRVVRRARPLAFMGATFVAVALLQWPLVWVVIVAGAASVALEYVDLTRS